jgi:DNA end-binding protein Ku
MRSILNCALRLPGGQVTIPVGLATTVKSGALKRRRLHRACFTPVEERTWCPLHGQELTPEEMIVGWEIAKGEYVPFEEEELAQLLPQPQSSIELDAFVDAGELSPLAVDRSYYLKPRPEQLGHRSYLVLRAALELTQTVGLARIAAWKKEYGCAIRPLAGDRAALLLQTLHWAEDIVPAREIELDLADQQLAANEVELAEQLLSRYTKPLAKAEPTSRYRPLERALIEQKLAAGQKVTAAPAAAAPDAPVFDLADALKTSLRGAPRKRARTQKALAG